MGVEEHYNKQHVNNEPYLWQSICRPVTFACRWWPRSASPPVLWWLSRRTLPSRSPEREVNILCGVVFAIDDWHSCQKDCFTAMSFLYRGCKQSYLCNGAIVHLHQLIYDVPFNCYVRPQTVTFILLMLCGNERIYGSILSTCHTPILKPRFFQPKWDLIIRRASQLSKYQVSKRAIVRWSYL